MTATSTPRKVLVAAIGNDHDDAVLATRYLLQIFGRRSVSEMEAQSRAQLTPAIIYDDQRRAGQRIEEKLVTLET
jgi:hypothetical protein